MTVYPNGSIHASEKFDTYGGAQAAAEMTGFLEGLPDDLIVVIAVHDATRSQNIQQTTGAESVLYSLGAVAPVAPGVRESWLLVGHKGTGPKPAWIQQRHAAVGQGPVSLETDINYWLGY